MKFSFHELPPKKCVCRNWIRFSIGWNTGSVSTLPTESLVGNQCFIWHNYIKLQAPKPKQCMQYVFLQKSCQKKLFQQQFAFFNSQFENVKLHQSKLSNFSPHKSVSFLDKEPLPRASYLKEVLNFRPCSCTSVITPWPETPLAEYAADFTKRTKIKKRPMNLNA